MSEAKPTWDDKITEMRDTLEMMVTLLNKDHQWAAALAAQEALQKVARLDGVIEFAVAEVEWDGKGRWGDERG